MRVLIVDDEAPARERLQAQLAELPDCVVVAALGSGEAALHRCADEPVDLVLLDIRMPGIDGLETARHLNRLERPPAIIFTTAYGEHALEAFDNEAIDYLLKPIRRERLARAIAKAGRLSREQLRALEPKRPTHLTTRINGNLRLIPLDEVSHFVADNKYVTAFHHDGELLLDESLKGLEGEFGGQLLRIHRNAVVVLKALVGIERDGKGGCFAVLAGSTQRPEVSRRHISEVKQALKEKA